MVLVAYGVLRLNDVIGPGKRSWLQSPLYPWLSIALGIGWPILFTMQRGREARATRKREKALADALERGRRKP